MRLQDLAYIHPGGNAQWIEDNVHRRPILEIGHVLLGKYSGQNALVSVTAGHLVPYGQLPFDRDVHLDQLDHARGELISGLQFLDLLREIGLDKLLLPGKIFIQHANPVLRLLIGDKGNLPPEIKGHRVQNLLGDDLAFLQQNPLLLWVGNLHRRCLSDQHGGDLHPHPVGDDLKLIVPVLVQKGNSLILDILGTAVPFGPLARKYLCIDHRAFDAGRNTQGGIPDITGLFSEDCPEELLFRGELRFALGGDLSDEDVPRLHRHAHTDDAAVIQISQRLFSQIGDIPRNLFLAELRIPRHRLKFLDMNRGIDILLDNPLADQDRVLVVVSPPGHKGDHHVPPQSQLSLVRCRSVRNDLSLAHLLTLVDNRFLVKAGVLIGALVLDQIVDIDTGVQSFFFR